MMKRALSFFRKIKDKEPDVGRIAGVRVRLHYSWLLAVVFITAAVVTQFSTDYPMWLRITLGVASSVLFFFAVLTREFVLNFIATQKGVTVRRITLFPVGGVQDVDKTSINFSLDILLAVAGMLTNLIIAGVFLILYTALVRSGSIVVHVLVQWLAFICFMLAVLHFFPGFPLDAGRVLRALLWKATGNYEKMTRIAGWIGWSIGLTGFFYGIYITMTSQEWFTGFLLIFASLILQNAATHSRRLTIEDNPV